MGVVYQANKGLIKDYAEETIRYSKALIEPGRKEAEVKLAPFSEGEVDALLLKLDVLAAERMNPAVAVIVAEEAESILITARMVKTDTKAEFAGILGAGSNLEIVWLRAKDVGGPLLNPAGEANKGLYGGASGGVYTWLYTFTANTVANIVPDQIMAEHAGMIYLGFIDPIEVPKVEAVRYTLAGIPSPAQSLAFRIRQTFGVESLPVARLEKPVIVGPERKQAVDLIGGIDGDSKPEPLALLISKAESIVL